MSNNLELQGARSGKATRYSPLYTGSFFSGIFTQRSPLRGVQSHIAEKYYPTFDAMLDGSNIELSNRLTPVRRPGNSAYNSQTFNDVLSFYNLNLFSTSEERIKVLVDTSTALYDGTGLSTKSLIWTKSTGAGQTFMLGVGNILFFGNGVDQKKWQNTLLTWIANTAYDLGDGFPETFIIDPNGNIEQITACIIPVTNVAVAANVLTITSSATLTQVLTTGLDVEFTGIGTATFLNGQTVTITAVGANTFSAGFNHANYSAGDTGLGTVVSGGSPVSGSVQPTWATGLLATTNDGTAQWTNRGNPIENWGIVAPTLTEVPTVQVGASNVSWQAGTYYSNSEVIVDSNGNLQHVTTAGKSGTSVPTWATVDGNTTTDGTVVWTQIQTVAELTWAAHTSYTAGHFLVASAVGTNCLFQRAPDGFKGGGVETVGVTSIDLWSVPSGSQSGQFIQSHASPVLPNATSTCTSLLFNAIDITQQPMRVTALNGAGESTGTTALPSPSSTHYNMAVSGFFNIPVAGKFTFTVAHQNGFYFGLGQSGANVPVYVSGITSNPTGQSVTRIQGYPIIGANNNRGPVDPVVDSFVINFPAAGTYGFEFDFAQNDDHQQLTVKANNFNIPPQPSISGATQPIWPAWTTSFAPAYPSVAEASGQYVWLNLGPVTDYQWAAKIQFLTTPTIIDPNNNTEAPYETGISGAIQPTFAPGINQLTNDNPHLIWINQGPAPAPPVGTISTFNGGWQYAIALVNTLDDTVSNAGPITPATGNFVGSTGVHISGGLPANIDPQVDYVAIFRTDDGGSTPDLFLIPGTGNSIYTVPLQDYIANGYTDTTLDNGLNILIQAPVGGQNTPPSTGAINLTYHLNRIFFSIGNTVYWTAGPDTPVGNGTNGVPPLNNAVFPSLVKRIVPTGIGAIVFTVSDVYLLSGQATASNPIFSQPFLPGKGILSYNALTTNGTLIYVFTTAKSVMVLDPSSGFSDLGFPIGDQFKSSQWDASQVYLTWHEYGEDVGLYVADGLTGWFRCNPTPAPETGVTWSPFAAIQGGVKTVQSIEVSPGVKKLLLGFPVTGPILNRDLTVWSDNSAPYEAFFVIGSIVLAQPGQVAELGFLTTDSVAIGTRPSISVLLDEISGPFEELARWKDDPPQLAPSQSIYAQRFYFAENESPNVCRHLQYRVGWVAEAVPSELLAATIFGGFYGEK